MSDNLVITIGRQCGSAGKVIGQQLAENYESQFNRVFDGKNIKIIIQQPISI